MPSNKNIIYLVFSIVFTIIKGQISPIIPVNNPYSYGMYNTYTPYSTGYSSYYPRNYLYYPQIPPSSISNPFLSGYTNYIDGMSSLNYLNPSLSSLMLRNGMSNSYLNSYMLGLPSSYSWNSRSGISGLSGYEGSLSPNTLSNYIQPDISIPPMGIADTTSLSRNILTNQYIPGTGSGTCKDQLPQCAVYASTGQCSSSPLIMARLCPISCGTGCSTSDLVSGGVNSLNTLSTMGSIDSPFTTLSTGLNGYGNILPLTNNVRSGIYPLTERKPSSSMINAISSIPELKTNNYDRESIHLSRKERTNKLRELLEMASE